MAQRTSNAFVVVISGPSGVGKTTLVDRLIESDPLLVESVSTTTRAAREGEVSGTHYFFVTREVFEQMKDRELVEWAEVHGEYYGTPRRFVEQELAAGRDVVLNIDIQGGRSVKMAFPDAVTVFILPPSFDDLRARMRQRGDYEGSDLEGRLATARDEIRDSKNYSYIVVNDDLDRAVADLCAIVKAERCRSARLRAELIEKLEG